MGKKWDYDIPGVEVWQECLRVLKPGGHILVACGTRTQHRMAVNIEDAGFEIRDIISWVYGSGFPKNHDIGKKIDQIQGNEREEYYRDIAYSDSDCWSIPNKKGNYNQQRKSQVISTNSVIKEGGKIKATKGNSSYEGFGTALKPSMELWTMARKPIEKGLTIAENCLKWNTGGINIAECRVEATDGGWKPTKECNIPSKGHKGGAWSNETFKSERTGRTQEMNSQGRYPANLIHSGEEEVVSKFPDTKTGKVASHSKKGMWGSGADTSYNDPNGGGSASRFFKQCEFTEADRIIYTPKASKAERNKGLGEFEEKKATKFDGGDFQRSGGNNAKEQIHKNNHPTVKPIALMKYLTRLITPKNGICLDPYAGSGSTGIACKLEGFDFIGIEREEEYCEIARTRIEDWEKELKQDELL